LNRNKLTELLLHPDKVTSRNAAMLAEMVEQYPYAGVLHILRAKSGQGGESERQYLGMAALYTPNRQILRQVMENKLPALESGTIDEAPVQQTPPPAPEQQVQSLLSTPSSVPANSPAPEHQQDEEEERPPSSKADIFEELQENLRQLRASRNKSYSGESSAEGSQNSDLQGTSAVSETVEQLVKDHQEQSLENPRVQHQRSLIDSFLQNGSTLPRRPLQQEPSADEQITDLSQQASYTPPDLATETLARIMERQGKTEKAIDIYQNLILKYPQKSAYFADCIERLKKN
jgi:hypothetical protein